MSRSILSGAAAIAAAALVSGLPASAQESAGIVVSAPSGRIVEQPRTGAQPRRLLVSNVVVYTGDLDLRTAYGRSVLDQRVRVAADEACDRLDSMEATGFGSHMNPDSGDCRHLARKNAEPRVRTAVMLARL